MTDLNEQLDPIWQQLLSLDLIYSAKDTKSSVSVLAVNVSDPGGERGVETIWHHCTLDELGNLPFVQRYDLAVVNLYDEPLVHSDERSGRLTIVQQGLVRLRDLLAKQVMIRTSPAHEQLLRSLGYSRLMTDNKATAESVDQPVYWQFNILEYKQVPDWLNAKFWANPENFGKYRW